VKNEKLSRARSGLIVDHPFFASILLGLPMVENTTISTMATDGATIEVNPKFLDSLSLSETTFVLAHETLHCVFEHMFRRGDRTPNRWNIAADYVINEILIKDKVGSMPKGGLYDPALVKQGNGTTEGVYALLPKDSEEKGAGSPGGAMDSVKDGGKDAADTAQKKAEMQVKVIQARNAAKMMGKLSVGLARIVEELTKPESNWREVLRRFLSERAKIDLSYAKPKRRFLADDLYLPSLTGEKLGVVAVGVDCSGSINNRILGMFEAEVRAIFQDASPTELQILYFDAKVLKTESYTDGDLPKLSPIGGGGTMFGPVFEGLEGQEVRPVACIMLTDLLGDFGKSTPSFPVLWASTRRDVSAPFGEIMFLKEET
jgi:predicted metal-dependent peptidase